MEQDCVFCKITRGEIPSIKIYEDADYLAFMDIRPRAPGHALVIPKQHYRWVWDVPDIGTYFEKARDVARAIQKAFSTDMVHSKVEGEEVHHAHIWLYPDPKNTLGNKDNLVGNAEKIRTALG
ncbi:hypothetical protein A2761_01410 [Candidatus Kaiserbacteria bacterium RIFCSPHIGHO2_01_FULL_51_33]|uniref:HIT domain-containing protein n=1 Tax=Candidatus Kaiserbacteria bacterium RIFCSPLOWO2_01_FULL_51_21 TaxID=1798508 RepID=A0A1F6ECN1_9BACT|nr:MAG: hypothetical protein A2761_01410 [Candidatus Kaiserbacteria bacterium RIFCSPHIGHO2_01_FULL_51_33]OGG71411.1 MAG: hypothetical protein A3A35_01560 [Candidatus Kaiserbacteria bacterium RIFCSPLOWO2_01_FULL_51_21]